MFPAPPEPANWRDDWGIIVASDDNAVEKGKQAVVAPEATAVLVTAVAARVCRRRAASGSSCGSGRRPWLSTTYYVLRRHTILLRHDQQAYKTRWEIQKIREIDCSYLCPKQFDKFWIWSSCNDRKQKSSGSPTPSDRPKQCFTVLPEPNKSIKVLFPEPKPNRTKHVKSA